MKAINLFIAIGLLTAGSIGSASAAVDLAGKLGFQGRVGLLIPVGTDFVKDRSDLGGTVGGAIRYFPSSMLGVEWSYDRLEFGEGEDQSNRMTGNLYTMSALIVPAPLSPVRPVFALGLGAGNIHELDGQPSSFTNWQMRVGAGAEGFFSESFSLGLMFDYHYITTENSSCQEVHVMDIILPFTFYLGM